MSNKGNISNQVIIHRVLEFLKNKGYKGLTARPWNYFKPESTLWWLVPSTEWPAYKYGKLVLSRKKEGYEIGLNIEKGISEKVCQVLNGKKDLCVRDDWVWNDFLEDLLKGKFENNLEEISNAANKPVKVLVQASTVNNEYDPYSEKIEGLETEHVISFKYSDGNFECIQDELKGEMRRYGNISKVSDLNKIFVSKDMEWFWIDIYIVLEAGNENIEQIPEYALIFVEKYGDLFGEHIKLY